MARKAGPGRPSKPVALKVLDGTYRESKDGPLAEQVMASGVPVAPADLDGEARAFWDQVVPGLVAIGVAVAMDAPELVAMCQWHARYVRYGRQMDGVEPTSIKPNQLIYLTGVAWMNFDKIASRFGLTPSDRAKLRVKPAGGCESKTPVPARKRG